MKIFDCFTFNNELDLLEFRLEKLYDSVDHFVLIESAQTHTGLSKPLYFKESKERFSKWLDKIAFFDCPMNKGLQNWDYEHFQRDFIRQCLTKLNCNDEDVVFVSDVDEVINISHILSNNKTPPFRIEIPFYYYFVNVRASETWQLNLCIKWSDLKKCYIGDRTKYLTKFPELLNDDEGFNGAHFSYLFSYSIKSYQDKISSFAHSEYNNFYYKNSFHLNYCIRSLEDIYSRSWMKLTIDHSNNFINGSSSHLQDKFVLYYPKEYNKLQLYCMKKYINMLHLIYRLFLKLKIL